MTNRDEIPKALRVASNIFLIMAIIAVVEMIYYLLSGSLRFQFNVLGFWIYFGLRKYSIGWRKCALVLIWIQLIVLPIMFVFSISAGRLTLDAVIDAALFLLELWLYRVLTRPGISYLFYDRLAGVL